ncbi:MAG TPA: hypothetical protein VG347_08370, partial [Verrucomicrobiae bacterium]|nr:hypothetical protein [Verrucomicrobiae bacterium]
NEFFCCATERICNSCCGKTWEMKNHQENHKLQEALSRIAELSSKHGPAQLAKFLNDTGRLPKLSRVTIFKWIEAKKKNVPPPWHDDSVSRIILAAELLQNYSEGVATVRFAVIKNASEHILVFLLKKHPELNKSEITVELVVKKHVAECFAALERNEVDLIIAPRPPDEIPETDKVQKICKIEEVPVSGIFPGEHFNWESLAAKLKTCVQNEPDFRVGCLVNANYRSVLDRLMGDAIPPKVVHVENYDDATEKFKQGKIHAAIGHSIFIANCYARLKPEIENPRSTWPHHIHDLRLCERIFRKVKMDIFVNVQTHRKHVIRRTLGLMYNTVKYINSKKDDDFDALAKIVNEELNLQQAPAKSGEHIIKEFTFTMETFEASTLFGHGLWEGV